MNVDRKSPVQEILVIIVILFSLGLFVLLHSAITDESLRCRLTSGLAINATNELKNIGEDTKPEHHQRVRRLPQAIIIGSRKCGTRALLKFLELNPAIRAARSEVHFFDKPHNYKLGFDWYRSQMPESKQNEVTIEKSPAYFVTQEVAERVRLMNSSIKLILIFRDPVTRLISDFSQLIANKITTSSEHEENDYSMNGDEHYSEYFTAANDSTKLAWDKAKKEFENYALRSDGGIDDQRKAIKTSMYSNYLEKWRASFPIEQFHFVDGEILISNPFEELHKLELFLGLKPTIKETDFVFNHKKGFFCIANSNVPDKQDIPVNSSSYHDMKSLKDLPKATCLSRSKGRRHVTVSKDLIGKLQKFYAPYNEYLYSLTRKRFKWGAM